MMWHKEGKTLFTIKGTFNEEPLTISYTFNNGCGELSGDPMIMFLVKDAMKSVELAGRVGQ